MTDHIETPHTAARAAQAGQVVKPEGQLTQVHSATSMAESVVEVSPFGALQQRFVRLGDRLQAEGRRGTGQPGRVMPIMRAREAAKDFSGRRNRELDPDALVAMLGEAEGVETADALAEVAQRYYPDVTLRDDAFDFLEETTGGDLQGLVREAREIHRERFEVDIRAGRNVTDQAREFSEQGLGTPTELRDLYRQIVDTCPSPMEMFKLLMSRYHYG